MKNILSLSIALLVGVITSQPVYAKNDHGGGRGGGGHAVAFNGGGGGRAMAVHGGGGGMMRPIAAPRSFTPSRSVARVQAPSFNTGRSVARVQAPQSMPIQRRVQPQFATTRAARTGTFNGSGITAARAQRGGIGSPTIAFGGRSTRRGGGSFAVPGSVSGGWDRGNVHEWNHHRYGWRGNDWVILDADPYAYGYGYGYDYPYAYDSGDTYATVSTSAPNLTASVQQALDDKGYDAGPADGVIGPRTRDAIANFQSDHGLRPTGDINDRLISALGL